MSKALTPQRWFHSWRASAPPPDTDPADFGTAFGLDLSLAGIQHEPVAVVAPKSRQPNWVSRLAARRRSAA